VADFQFPWCDAIAVVAAAINNIGR
jgi:hypothetical protein